MSFDILNPFKQLGQNPSSGMSFGGGGVNTGVQTGVKPGVSNPFFTGELMKGFEAPEATATKSGTTSFMKADGPLGFDNAITGPNGDKRGINCFSLA